MTDKKVEFHRGKPVIEIDGTTGEVKQTRVDTIKGFGRGFRDYVLKGPKQTLADITVNTGAWPATHARAGKWVVQIMIDPFETEEDAITMADRVKNVVDAELRRVK